MKTVASLILSAALLAATACKQSSTEQARHEPTPAPRTTVSPQSADSPHPNQVAVSLGKTSTEAAPLNPRIAEAYSPASVTLERTAAAPSGFPGAPAPQNESPPPGMKWVIVIVETGAAQGEVSIPLSKIRIVDQTGKAYRLVSFGGSAAGTFMDLREYDKYKMVEPPKLIMKSPIAGKQNFLFAVAVKAGGLQLEF
jgi:hypothetical protein